MRGDKRKRTTIEYYECPVCGFRFPIPRKKCREKGHIKDLWCPMCKEERKMVKYDERDTRSVAERNSD